MLTLIIKQAIFAPILNQKVKLTEFCFLASSIMAAHARWDPLDGSHDLAEEFEGKQPRAGLKRHHPRTQGCGRQAPLQRSLRGDH